MLTYRSAILADSTGVSMFNTNLVVCYRDLVVITVCDNGTRNPILFIERGSKQSATLSFTVFYLPAFHFKANASSKNKGYKPSTYKEKNLTSSWKEINVTKRGALRWKEAFDSQNLYVRSYLLKNDQYDAFIQGTHFNDNSRIKNGEGFALISQIIQKHCGIATAQEPLKTMCCTVL